VSEVNSNAKSALFSLLFVKRIVCVCMWFGEGGGGWWGDSIETHACVLNQRQQIRLENDEDLPVLGDYFSVFFFYFFLLRFFSFLFYVIVKIYYIFLSLSDSLFFPLRFFCPAIMSALMPKFVFCTPRVLHSIIIIIV